MNKGKKLVALFVCAMLLMGTMPVTALSDATNATKTTEKTTSATPASTKGDAQELKSSSTPTSQATDVQTNKGAEKALRSASSSNKAQSAFEIDASGKITKYNGAGGDIVIPESINGTTVLAIASGIFSNSTVPINLTIPATVKTIDNSAFLMCNSLNTVKILGDINIGVDAFSHCEELTSVEISGVATIGVAAFAHCYKLVNVTIPKGATTIGESAFMHCKLTNVQIPSATSIGDHAFRYCQFSSIKIPAGVKTIGDAAFMQNHYLTSVTIPDGVTSIGGAAFSRCEKITNVTIPSSVTTIGEYAFSSNDSMTDISVAAGNTKYVSVDGVLYNKDKTTLIAYPAAKAGKTFTVPSTVTSIGTSAFSSCNGITNLIIPSSVTSIAVGAFAGNKTVADISVAAGNRKYASEDGVLYNKDKTSLIIYPDAKADKTFTVPSTVTSLGSGVFSGKLYLEKIILPSTLKSVDSWAFNQNAVLKELVFNGNAPTITGGDGSLRWEIDVFEGTTAKVTIYYRPGATGFTTPKWMDQACYPVGATPNPPTPPTTPPTEKPTPPTEKPTPTPPTPTAPKLNTSIVNGAPGGKIVSRIVLPGDTAGYQYKFVWSYNNWKKWGIIRDFGSGNIVSFKPVHQGNYEIYVDIKDKNGKITTTTNKFDITLDKASDAKVSTTNTTPGKPVTIEGSSTGMNAQYKFVWSRNNWDKGNWGVFREFSTNNKYTFTPTKAGRYEFFVDVKDGYGNITTKKQVVTVRPNFTPALNLSVKKPAVNNKIVMNANATGETEELQYKYVWSYNNWSKWGVSKNFSKDTAASFMPKWPGKYEMYVDVMDKHGNVVTQSKVINISK